MRFDFLFRSTDDFDRGTPSVAQRSRSLLPVYIFVWNATATVPNCVIRSRPSDAVSLRHWLPPGHKWSLLQYSFLFHGFRFFPSICTENWKEKGETMCLLYVPAELRISLLFVANLCVQSFWIDLCELESCSLIFSAPSNIFRRLCLFLFVCLFCRLCLFCGLCLFLFVYFVDFAYP